MVYVIPPPISHLYRQDHLPFELNFAWYESNLTYVNFLSTKGFKSHSSTFSFAAN